MTLAQLTQQCINLLRTGTPGETPVCACDFERGWEEIEEIKCDQVDNYSNSNTIIFDATVVQLLSCR